MENLKTRLEEIHRQKLSLKNQLEQADNAIRLLIIINNLFLTICWHLQFGLMHSFSLIRPIRFDLFDVMHSISWLLINFSGFVVFLAENRKLTECTLYERSGTGKQLADIPRPNNLPSKIVQTNIVQTTCRLPTISGGSKFVYGSLISNFLDASVRRLTCMLVYSPESHSAYSSLWGLLLQANEACEAFAS